MEYTPTLRNFGPAPTADEVSALLEKIGPQARRNCRTEVYKRCFGCIDLTSLGATDSRRSIGEFTRKAIELPRHFPEAGSVASICVYPVFVETVGLAAGDSKMAITSVSGGFPSSQTYLEVKMLETAMAIENGADEIDIVISIGEMLDGEYDLAGNEIETLRAEIGDDAILKVILESGTLSDPELIHKAATIAMEAGADFIKTSTGKNGIAATPRLPWPCASRSASSPKKQAVKWVSKRPEVSLRPKARHSITASSKRSSAKSGSRPSASASAPVRWPTTCSARSKDARSNTSKGKDSRNATVTNPKIHSL